MAKLLVGLGNIGKEYEKTNHNMGFMVVDKVADELNVNFKKNICSSFVGEANLNGEKIILAKPTTYMNSSGIAVKSLVNKFNIDISKDLLIISDDFDLPTSCVRVRTKGSAGTHNGLKSIVEELQSTEFPRLRIGVGKPNEHQSVIDFVLEKAHFGEELEQGLEKGKQASIMFLQNRDFEEIMRTVN